MTMTKQEIFDSINLEAALNAKQKCNRDGGSGEWGHKFIMDAIFQNTAIVLAYWRKASCCGNEVICYEFPDKTICLITDEFGSCEACDTWANICSDDTSERAITLIRSMVSSARIFNCLAELIDFCNTLDQNIGEQFLYQHAKNLLPDLIDIYKLRTKGE